jgi:hypothetical protein
MYNCDFQARLAEACPAFQIPGGHELCPPPRCWSFKLIDQECAMSDASRFERSTRLNVLRLPGGQAVTVRAISPQDADCLQAYIRNLSAPARRNRFLGAVSELAPRELNRLTHMNGPPELALVVFARTGGETTMIGEAVQVIAPESRRCEIALSVGCVAAQRPGHHTAFAYEVSREDDRRPPCHWRNPADQRGHEGPCPQGGLCDQKFAHGCAVGGGREGPLESADGLPCHEQFSQAELIAA